MHALEKCADESKGLTSDNEKLCLVVDLDLGRPSPAAFAPVMESDKRLAPLASGLRKLEASGRENQDM